MSTSPGTEEQLKVQFEQYKLAVDMAAGISSRRQAANNFYISLVSGFGVLNSVLGNAAQSVTASARELLLVLPICFCVLWWLTIRSYRRINQVKWNVIYELEKKLPEAPFTLEDEKLGRKSFKLTKVELAIPVVVGLVFLLLALRPFLTWAIH